MTTTFHKLLQLFMEITDHTADASLITLDSNLQDDLGFSSLTLLLMALAIEREFKVDIAELSLAEVHTVGDVCAFIERMQKSGQSAE